MPVDGERARKAVSELLEAFGLSPERDPELAETPARVAHAWATELIDGYDVDVAKLLADEHTKLAAAGELVVLRDVSISTICPHHLLPARGTADVAYRPVGKVAGLGTVVRVVDAFAHRLALQEAIGNQVAGALVEHLGAAGAACRLRLVHACLASRGERRPDVVVETIAFAGSFRAPGAERDLVMGVLGPPASGAVPGERC